MHQPYIPSLYITFWCSKQRKNFVLKFDYWKERKEFPWWELKAPHWTWLSSRRTPSSPVLSIFKFYISKVQYLLNCIFIVVQSRQSTDYREQTLHRSTDYKTVKRIFNIELYLCKKLDTDIRTDMPHCPGVTAGLGLTARGPPTPAGFSIRQRCLELPKTVRQLDSLSSFPLGEVQCSAVGDCWLVTAAARCSSALELQHESCSLLLYAARSLPTTQDLHKPQKTTQL